MRAFVALDVPEELIQPITRLQAGLTVGRLVPDEHLHVTLAFMPRISEAEARDVAEELDVLRAKPISLSITGLDVMGGTRPNLIAATVEANAPLVALQEKVARMVRRAGVELERRSFRPHVTLARFPNTLSQKDQRGIQEFLALNARFGMDPKLADRVTLYESHLTEDGPIYDPLAEAYLR